MRVNSKKITVLGICMLFLGACGGDERSGSDIKVKTSEIALHPPLMGLIDQTKEASQNTQNPKKEEESLGKIYEEPQNAFSLFWSGVKIEKKLIKELAMLSKEDLIKTIREKYGLTVIILKNPNENSKNLEGEEKSDSKEENMPQDIEIVQGYERDEDLIEAIFEEQQTMYLSPYDHDSEHLFLERPGMNKQLLLIKRGALKPAILREFVRFYISAFKKENPIEINGVKHSLLCARIKGVKEIEVYVKERLAKQKEIMKKQNKSPLEEEEALEELSYAFARRTLELAKWIVQRGGEGVDFFRLLYFVRKELNFQDVESLIADVVSRYQDIAGALEQSRSVVMGLLAQKKNKRVVEIQNEWKAFEKVISPKIKKTENWIILESKRHEAE